MELGLKSISMSAMFFHLLTRFYMPCAKLGDTLREKLMRLRKIVLQTNKLNGISSILYN